jgi:hypothetical protein
MNHKHSIKHRSSKIQIRTFHRRLNAAQAVSIPHVTEIEAYRWDDKFCSAYANGECWEGRVAREGPGSVIEGEGSSHLGVVFGGY